MKPITIINIIFNIINLIILIINIRILLSLKKTNKKDNKQKPVNFNEDEYFNSLKFNTLLDNEIRPLLGKYSNENIVKMVTLSVMKKDNKITNQNKLSDYIRDLLLNYNNSYQEQSLWGNKADSVYVDELMDNEQEFEELYSGPIMDSSVNKNNTQTDISNVFSEFYK